MTDRKRIIVDDGFTDESVDTHSISFDNPERSNFHENLFCQL